MSCFLFLALATSEELSKDWLRRCYRRLCNTFLKQKNVWVCILNTPILTIVSKEEAESERFNLDNLVVVSKGEHILATEFSIIDNSVSHHK